ncbi:MAG: ribonuclease III domain-containing protein [Promethearchaeota archaeon]
MNVNNKEKLRKFQDLIGYDFKEEELLVQALTTPQLGNLIGKPSYDFLETLGDAVIKLIFILKLYKMDIKKSGEITKIKAKLESDKTLKHVAKQIKLEDYIFKTEKQKIKNTRIFADIFEALCGAIFLDSNQDLNIVEKKLIDPFYGDINKIIQNSIISSKNQLLEYLQEKFKTNITIALEYEKYGVEHDLLWMAKNPRILDKEKKELLKIPIKLQSSTFKTKKEAEKSLFKSILDYLKKREI